MAQIKLRDRDSVVTTEGIILRIFGYSHPPNSLICDAEYASSEIFRSTDPRAPRTGGNQSFYKFYNDEGWKFIFEKFPQYTLFHEILGKTLVGIKQDDITTVRKPEKKLQFLLATESMDILHSAMKKVLHSLLYNSGLSISDFGVFGSLLHGFYHPEFSDIDFVVFGLEQIQRVRAALNGLYSQSSSDFRNEFETDAPMKGKPWRFKNYSAKEFLWHQERKLIYSLFDDSKSGRKIKIEFEPVKDWLEIIQEYNVQTRIFQKGWVKLRAQILSDKEAPFLPSIYKIEPLEVLKGPKVAIEATRVVSYMEEFRLQARKDEKVILEGSLEELVTPESNFYQIALTYCPRYYEQVLKVTV